MVAFDQGGFLTLQKCKVFPVFHFLLTAFCPGTTGFVFVPSLQILGHLDDITPELSLFQAEQSSLSQLLLMGEMLQSLLCFCGSSMASLQHIQVSLVLGTPELDTVFQLQPYHC